MKISEISVLPIYAMRYAVTRLTWEPLNVMVEIIKLLPQMPISSLKMIQEELETGFEYKDNYTWEQLLQAVKEERESRSERNAN
ncbi:hypothetical protein AALA22_15965 [Anaerovoracaceae bacterium 41-7]